MVRVVVNTLYLTDGDIGKVERDINQTGWGRHQKVLKLMLRKIISFLFLSWTFCLFGYKEREYVLCIYLRKLNQHINDRTGPN